VSRAVIHHVKILNHKLLIGMHSTLSLLDLPVGESDGLKRLRICNAEYEDVRTSVSTCVTGWLAEVAGSYPNFIGKHVRNTFSGALVSYFRAGTGHNKDERFEFNGRRVLSAAFFLGPQHGSSGKVLITIDKED
jgi:hypothetical protein